MKLDWNLLLVILTMLLGSLLTQESTAQVTVQIRNSELRVAKSTVQLGDIATFTANNDSVAQKLRNIDIDSFIGSASEIRVTKEQVRIRLLLAGFDLTNADISGPIEFKVRRIEQEDTRLVIQTLLGQQLSSQFSIPESAIQVTVDSNFKLDNEHHMDYQTLRLEPLGRAEIPLGKSSMPTMLRDSRNKFQPMNIPVTVAIYRELAVAKTDIARGTILTRDHLDSVRRPVSNNSSGYLTMTLALGKQVNNDISMYDLIKPNSINSGTSRQDALVKRNSIISGIVRSGRLTVELKNIKAMEEADLGDTIQVINMNNNERLIGKVVDANTVELR